MEEEQKVIRHLSWFYYGIMVLTLLVLTGMYYLTGQEDFEPYNPNEGVGLLLQYIVMGMALICIPFGLYAVKFFKPKDYEKYEGAATYRICAVGLIMPLAICVYFTLGCHQPLMWIAGMAAIAFIFTKPTLGKMEQEMKPEDPNEETY